MPAPAVQQSLAVELALLDPDAQRRMDLELPSVRTAQPPDANPLSRRQPVPGLGQMFSLVLLDAIQDLDRLPRGQACAASGRLVQCAKAAAGTRDGPAGHKSGNASLPWAFAAAAGLFWRHHPPGQTCLARLEHKQGKGQAWAGRTHQLARAVSDLLQRDTGFARDQCLTRARSRAGEPDASLDPQGISLHPCPWHPWPCLRPSTRSRTWARLPEPVRWLGDPLGLWSMRRASATVAVCCPSPEPGSHWPTMPVPPPFCRGRYEGTE